MFSLFQSYSAITDKFSISVNNRFMPPNLALSIKTLIARTKGFFFFFACALELKSQQNQLYQYLLCFLIGLPKNKGAERKDHICDLNVAGLLIPNLAPETR